MSIINYIEAILTGYSTGYYSFRKYGIYKNIFNNGKSFKIFAKELSGNDFISLNFYITRHREYLKPCEMPEEKVLTFLKKVSICKK